MHTITAATALDDAALGSGDYVRMVAVLKTEDRYSAQPQWIQYFVIEVDTTILVEMDRALFGWNTRKISRKPTADDWLGMSVADIVDWKRHNHDVVVCDKSESRRVLDLLDRTPA